MRAPAAFYERIHEELASIRTAGLIKAERLLVTPQGAIVRMKARFISIWISEDCVFELGKVEPRTGSRVREMRHEPAADARATAVLTNGEVVDEDLVRRRLGHGQGVGGQAA